MSHLQSSNAAARLNDVLQERGWDRRGMRVFPTAKQWEVEVQYRSEAQGAVRVVACDADKLSRWIRANEAKPGCWVQLLSLLDRKVETHRSSMTPLLFPSAELTPTVRYSMSPHD